MQPMRAHKCAIADGYERARERDRYRVSLGHHRKRTGAQFRDTLANGNGGDG